jgi:hypothetical protein
MTTDPTRDRAGRNENDSGPPFESHRVYYMVLKFAVLALAVWLAVKLTGLW